MRHDAVPAARFRFGHQDTRVMGIGAAFETVEKHEKRGVWSGSIRSGLPNISACRIGLNHGIGAIRHPVEIDEITIRRGPPLSPIPNRRPVPEQRRHDGLRMRGGQPSRRPIQQVDQRLVECSKRRERIQRRIARWTRRDQMIRVAFHGAVSNTMRTGADQSVDRHERAAAKPRAPAHSPSVRAKPDVNAADLARVAFSPQSGPRLRLASH